MARTGRPTGCTAEVVGRVCTWVQSGNDPKTACLAEGVPESTVRLWFDRALEAEAKADSGEKLTANDDAHLHLLREVTRARALFECQTVAELNTAETGGKEARPDPRPKQWLLERVFPDRYGQKITVAHQEEAAKHLVTRLAERLPPEVLVQVREALQPAD